MPTYATNFDTLYWGLTHQGKFTVQSIYNKLLHHCLPTVSQTSTPQYAWIWKIPVTSKIKTFLWLIIHNRLPTRQYLHHIGILLDDRCKICNSAQESINHIFLNCPNVHSMWAQLGLTDVVNHINRLSQPSEWLMPLMKAKTNAMPYRINNQIVLSYTLWHIWLTRNDNNFNHTQHELSIKFVTNQALEFTYLATKLKSKPNTITTAYKMDPSETKLLQAKY